MIRLFYLKDGNYFAHKYFGPGLLEHAVADAAKKMEGDNFDNLVAAAVYEKDSTMWFGARFAEVEAIKNGEREQGWVRVDCVWKATGNFLQKRTAEIKASEKCRPAIPPEVWNTQTINPDTAMAAIRDMCKGTGF